MPFIYMIMNEFFFGTMFLTVRFVLFAGRKVNSKHVFLWFLGSAVLTAGKENFPALNNNALDNVKNRTTSQYLVFLEV